MPLMLLLIPLATALACILTGSRKLIGAFNLAGGIAVTAVSLTLARTVFGQGPVHALGSLIYIDSLGAFVICLVAIVGLAAAVYSIGYTAHEISSGEVPETRLKWYYFWFYLFLFTMLLVVMVNNLGIMWVAIEATTLTSALLVAYYDKRSSLEAAWKYIIICTVGIVFALFGTILLYYAAVAAAGESGALNWQTLMGIAGKLDPKLVKLAFIFILVGYGTKAGLAPMHTWLPDAHSQAPSPVSALLSGVLLNCALYGILRFHIIVSKAVGPDYSTNLLLIFGILSIAISLPFILVQHDFKRLLAYSSIEHMGIITAAVGLGGKLGLYGACLHMLNHALAKSSLFFVAGNVTQKYRTKNIGRIKGVIQVMPVTGTALLLGILAIAGLPPFNIFISEFTIISAGFAEGRYVVTSLILVLISLAFAGLVFAASKMALGSAPGKVKPGEQGKWSVVPVIVLMVSVVGLGIYIPAYLQNILGQVVSVLAGGN